MNENMIFEGKTERDAIEKAAFELGSESFDVEVIEKTGGLFGFGKVRIRVKALDSIPGHTNEDSSRKKNKTKTAARRVRDEEEVQYDDRKDAKPPRPLEKEHVQRTIVFVQEMIRLMGFEGTLSQKEVVDSKLKLEIITEQSSRIIGRKGRKLDALQILANVYFHNIDNSNGFWRIILDSGGYRARREENLLNQALLAADKAVGTMSSCLLEPLNPFERHLIHKALSERKNIVTFSEGSGHYKRIRIKARNAVGEKSAHFRR